MKVYIAARYSTKEEMKHVAVLLKDKGIDVTSSWLQEPHAAGTTMDQVDPQDLCAYAQQDIEDIKAADVVVLFSVDPLMPTVRGGRHVETGIAIGLGKPLFVIGPVENIFHHLPYVKRFPTISELIEGLLKEAYLLESMNFGPGEVVTEIVQPWGTDNGTTHR